MKQKLTLLLIALFTTLGAWAIDVKIATFSQPVTKNGSWVSNYEFRTNAFSGLAGVTITAPNSDFNIGYATNATYGDGWVNDSYGYCLRFVTKDTNAHTVSLNAPSGYKIVGYSFFARSNTNSNNHILTPDGGSSITSTTSGVWVTVNEIIADNTTFTIQTQNGGNTLYVPQFTISLVADTKKVVDTKVTADKDNPIAYANIDDIANGATPVVLYNSGRGTYQFANPYDDILGGYSSSTGVINTSSVKFLVEKSDSKYKIINVDSRKFIPANGNVTMLPSAVSGAPTFTTKDNNGTTYTFQSGGSSFNGNAGAYGSFVYHGSDASGNSAYQIMRIASEETIEYTIPDLFFAPTAYYRIKAAGRGDYYLSAGSSDTYIRLAQDAFDHSGTQVWKTYLGSKGVKLYSMGVNKYVAFNKNRDVRGDAISAFTNSEQAAYNFIPEDKGSGNYAFNALAPLGNTYLSNNGGVSETKSMGYYTAYDDGARLQFERVYKVTLKSDAGDEQYIIFSDGNVTDTDLDDLDDYEYAIDGVAKTKNEVVAAINAVTDDNLVIVFSHHLNATISSASEIDQTKVYALTVSRGKWMYAASKTAYFSTAAYQSFNENAQWAFVTIDGGNNYYLYNVGQKCFIMSKFGSSNHMDSKYMARPVSFEVVDDASYPIRPKDGNYYFNENGGSLIISSYSNNDGGNRYAVQAIDDVIFDPTEAQDMLNAINHLPFEVSPAPSAGSFDAATIWYFISMRPADGNGGYYAYVPEDYDYTNPTNIPLEGSTGTKSEDDKYRWCITGSMDGYRLFNKAAGADRVFVFDGGGKIKDYSGNESTSLFYLAPANTPSTVAAPTFIFNGTNNRPNRQSNKIASWHNSDTGSEFGFTFDEAYDDNNFYAEYEAMIKPFMDAPVSSNYFCLTDDAQKLQIWNRSQYDDGIEHSYYTRADITAMWDGLVDNLKKPLPTTGMRLKNNNTGKYVSYGTATWSGDGLICNETFAAAEADLTSVLQFQNTNNLNYKIYSPAKGKYIGSQKSGNTPFSFVDDAANAAEFSITPLVPGVITLKDEASYNNADYPGYLHAAGWAVPGVVNYQVTSLSSHWNVEEAGTICFDMISPAGVAAGDVYMTYANNLGLPLKAPDEASVYIISTQDSEKAYMANVDSKEIPAGNGVILKAEKGSTVHMKIKTSTEETLEGNVLVAGDGSTTVAAGNFMLAYNSTDEIAKFYAIGSSGFVVPANKAYLPAMGSGSVKALILSFDDDDATAIQTIDNGQQTTDGTVYNLAGQRMNKMQKGINIVNGKKILK